MKATDGEGEGSHLQCHSKGENLADHPHSALKELQPQSHVEKQEESWKGGIGKSG